MAETVKQNWQICRAVQKVGNHTIFVDDWCSKRMTMCGHTVVPKSQCAYCLQPVQRKRKKKEQKNAAKRPAISFE